MVWQDLVLLLGNAIDWNDRVIDGEPCYGARLGDLVHGLMGHEDGFWELGPKFAILNELRLVDGLRLAKLLITMTSVKA